MPPIAENHSLEAHVATRAPLRDRAEQMGKFSDTIARARRHWSFACMAPPFLLCDLHAVPPSLDARAGPTDGVQKSSHILLVLAFRIIVRKVNEGSRKLIECVRIATATLFRTTHITVSVRGLCGRIRTSAQEVTESYRCRRRSQN